MDAKNVLLACCFVAPGQNTDKKCVTSGERKKNGTDGAVVRQGGHCISYIVHRTSVKRYFLRKDS